VFLGFVNHAIDFLLRQTALVVDDRNAARLAGGLVSGRHVQDTLGIDVEGDLDLWYAARCGRNTGEFELAQQVVVPSACTLALVDLNEQPDWLSE
jgi:hypothetical protein